MTIKKQTKKEKQNTIPQNHRNPETLNQLYVKEGKSAGEISRMFNVSRAAVLFQLRKFSIPITTRKQKSADAKEDYKNASWLRKQISAGIFLSH
jgi:hypothetical protein